MSEGLTIERVIERLASRFDPQAADDLSAVFQYRLEDYAPFYIAIAEGQCQVIRGEHDDPNITLIMDQATFMAVINGEMDGMSAFLKGRLRAEGNVMLATRLPKLFKRR